MFLFYKRGSITTKEGGRMNIAIIVAVAENGVIGNKGGLAWHLPAEMAHFKAITMGHPVIMGRKTHESIGRALPGRRNIVVTHNPDYEAPGCEIAPSLEEAIKHIGNAQAFVIGGSSIYTAALPLAHDLYLTIVHTSPEGDTFFNYDQNEWALLDSETHAANEKNPFAFTYEHLVRSTTV